MAAVRTRLGDLVDDCVVVAEHMAVGVLPATADEAATVGEAMVFGITTVRPSEEVDGFVHRMVHRSVDRIVVTDAAGRLLGFFEPEPEPGSAPSSNRVPF